MASNSFLLKIFTPAGKLFSVEVKSVLVPTVDGEIGVYPHHARYHGVLGTGVLVIEPTSGAAQRFIVSGGFCSFADEALTILADEAFATSEVEVTEYAKERSALAGTLTHYSIESVEWTSARRKLSVIEAIDSIVRQ